MREIYLNLEIPSIDPEVLQAGFWGQFRDVLCLQ